MKIAFVANTCWNIYNFRKGLVHHYLSKADEVFILAPFDEYTERVQEWGVKYIDTPLEGTGSNPLKDLKYLKTLNTIFKELALDCVLSFTIKSNIYSSVAAATLKTKVICNVSGLGTVFLTKGLTGYLAQGLYKIAFRFSDYVFFQNKDDQTLFTSKIKLRDNKLGLLPGSGIDLKAFKPVPLPQQSETRFLMISRLIIEKGVRDYAHAASAFSDNINVSFTLIGKFDSEHARSIDEEELSKWVKLGWLNYQPHSDDISNIIGEHDVVVLPSYREGTPRTLLEGAALGRPLLATNVPGCREVINDGYNGFLFEAMNANSLTRKIKHYLSLNESEKMQMAENSRRLVEKRFDERKVVEAYDRVIGLMIPTH